MGVIEVVNKGKVNIDEYLLSRIKESYGDLKIMVVADSNLVHGFEELGIPSVTLSSGELSTDGKTQALFIDDPSFAFDYSHILPDAEKCSVLHGHTSAILLEIIGRPENGMILDFGEAKKIVKDCLKIMDHKLFIARRYGVDEDTETFRIKFDGHNGSFDLRVPKGSTFTLDKEATVESLAEVVLRLVAPKMPRNVEALGVYIYEGLNKGSHLLASVTHKTHGEMES
jgi:6-pyruvoyltetrahydropterin/6-carboxytetrahydropterin synthase